MVSKRRGETEAVALRPKKRFKAAVSILEEKPVKCDRPVPFDTETAREECLNALLPWFAMGYGPVETKQGAKGSGIRALWRSFTDARELLKEDGERLEPATELDFLTWIESDNYRAKVEKLMQEEEMSEEEKEIVRAGMFQTNDLISTQLSLLLQVANEVLGTNFEVGFINRGWRCRVDADTKTWDKTFVKQISIGHDAELLIAEEKPSPAKPIIWLCNDDYFDRKLSRGLDPGDPVDQINQWEGFGIHKNLAQIIQDWNIGSHIHKDVAKGVWMVTEDSRKTDAPDKNYLDVLKGHFVRDTTPEAVGRADDCRYVRGCNNIDKGNVPKVKLRKIKLHDEVPTRDQEVHTTAEVKAPAPEAKIRLKRKEQTEATTETGPITNSRSTMKPFFVYRAIQATDKSGEFVNNADYNINGFEVENGDFLLDFGNRNDGNDGKWQGARTVKNINGEVGKVPFRRLQLLMENPWGLPNKLPVLHDIEITRSSGIVDLKTAAASRGLSTVGGQKEVYDQIICWERDNEVWIDLGYLKRVDRTDPEGIFIEHEILRVLRDSKVPGGNSITIMDYPGTVGRARLEDIETVGATIQTMTEGVAFGLRLDPNRISDNFDLFEEAPATPETTGPRASKPKSSSA